MGQTVKILSTIPVYRYSKQDVRLLVNGTTVKYATIDDDTYDSDWTKKDIVETVTLPQLATGDWTWVEIGKDPNTGLPLVKDYDRFVPQIQHIREWHATRIEYVDLHKVRQIPVALEDRREDRLHLVQHPLFSAPVLMKIAESPRHLGAVRAETIAYEAINGDAIGPEFLGHVTEGGRVVGFLTEWVEGARTAHWEDDRQMCAKALRSLHGLGFSHGDAHRGNFLVKGGRVYIIDFEYSRRCWEEYSLAKEIDHVLNWEPTPTGR